MSCCFSIPACNYGWSFLQIPCSLSFTPSALFLFRPFVVLFHPVCLLIFQDKNREKTSRPSEAVWPSQAKAKSEVPVNHSC